jgi:hypothetical protein
MRWALGLLLSSAAITACDGPHTCKKTTLSDENADLWNVTFTGCADKNKYAVLCVPDQASGITGFRNCSCAVNAVVTKTFTFPELPSSDEATVTAVMNASCGWAINTD